ncbi:MAG: iron-containing alcohol dehydrogenase [Cryobacterium sp.]|nr:iron-containing alcohol dehydrogenase [Cryobacterium sp.]
MGEFTRSRPKSMAHLSNGETIFGRQLRLLASAGISKFVVTTGLFADQLRAETEVPHLAGREFTFVPNIEFDSTNYIYSMYLARKHLDGDVLMLHGDLVFNRLILERLLADPRPDLAMVNETLPLPEKDFKARVSGGLVREVSVDIFDDDCYAFQPFYKLSERALQVWMSRVTDFVDRGEKAVYAENALNEVAVDAAIATLSYEGHSVDEVDTLDDLTQVSNKVRLFDFAEQAVLSEAEDVTRIPELLQSAGVHRPLLVGGKSFDASFVKPLLADRDVDFVRFSAYSANPKLDEVKAGVEVFRSGGCDAIVSVGGGSAIDVAKCIQILVASDSDVFPPFGASLSRRVPHLCVPTSAGTGSESTHFAVVYIDGDKHSIAHDAMVPDWVILEPRLLKSLPDYHKKASLLDSLSQCVESSWAASATDQSIEYAVQGIRLILDNVFAYFHEDDADEDAARQILTAANLGGKAINLTKTTAPHAMSYKMTELYDIAHGHAVALCLVGVWWYFAKLAADATPEGLSVAPALDRLTEVFGAENHRDAVSTLENLLEELRMPAPPLGDPANLDDLVKSVNQERLGNSPVALTEADIRALYEFVFALRSVPFSD